MRIVFSLVLLLLAIAPAVHAQEAFSDAAPLPEARVEQAEPPIPQLAPQAEIQPVQTAEVSVREEREANTEVLQERNRSFWFVAGALVAVAIVLAFALN